MDRDEILRILDAELHGEASDAERSALAEALAADAELAREAAELRRLRALFVATPRALVPADFTESVLARLGERTGSTGSAGSTGAAAGAAGGPALESHAAQHDPHAPRHDSQPAQRGRLRLLRAVPWVAGLAAATMLAVMLGSPFTDDRGAEKSVAQGVEPATGAARATPRDSAAAAYDTRSRVEADAEAGAESLGTRERLKRPSETPLPVMGASHRGAEETAASAPAATAPGVAAPLTEAARAPEDLAAERRDGGESPVADSESASAGELDRDGGGVGEGAAGGAWPLPVKPRTPAATTAAGTPTDTPRGERPDAAEAGAPAPNEAPRGAARAGDDGDRVRGSSGKKAASGAAGASIPIPDGGRTAARRQSRPAVEKRYVVFEDAEAAQRFLAALKAEEQRSKRRSADELAAADRADGGRVGAGRGFSEDDSAPSTGRGAASGSDSPDGRGSAPISGGGAGAAPARGRTSPLVGPRVVGRVVLSSANPVVVRTLSGRPAGAGFGRDVDPSVIAAAEQLARVDRAGGDGAVAFEQAGETPESAPTSAAEPPPVPDVELKDEAPESEPAPDAPPAKSFGARRGVASSEPAADPIAEPEIEFVVVIAPPGTLRARGPSAR